MKNKIIAVVGMSGSGKSVASEFLEKKGYQKVYFGGVIYDEMKKQGISITPESQKEFRENLRKEHGMGVVAQILLPKIKKLYEQGNVVLDGLYSWEEYKILERQFKENIILLSIVLDKNLRYNRLEKRKERFFSKEEAKKRDLSEIENSEKGGPIAYADYYIFNQGSLEEYEERLNEILKQIRGE